MGVGKTAIVLAAVAASTVLHADVELKCPRFGALFYGGETVELEFRKVGLALGGGTTDVNRVSVSDWRGNEVYSWIPDGDAGIFRISPADLKNRFGAFKAAFVGRLPDGRSVDLAKTWFARLSDREVKPVKWIGTGIHGYWRDKRRFELMRAAGIGTVRLDAFWRECEREKGVYTMPHPEFLPDLDAAIANGILINLDLPSDNKPVYPECPLDPDARARFAAWIAKALPQVSIFETFNEPPSHFYKQYLDDKGTWYVRFKEFSDKTKEAIRAVRPDADILVCAECEEKCLRRELKLGVAGKDDCVSFHPYVHTADPRPEREKWFWLDEGAEIRKLMAENGGATRIRLTEVGWTTFGVDKHGNADYWPVAGIYPGVSYVAQAQYLIRAWIIARQLGVECLVQYDFSDDGPRRNYTEHNFGLLFTDMTPKPSFAAVAFMARLLGDAEPTGLLDSVTDKAEYRVYGFRAKNGKNIYAMWAVEDEINIHIKADLPPDAVGGTVYDLMGNARQLDPALKSVELSERPYYVVGK